MFAFQVTHFIAYLCGGVFFVAGSACYYWPTSHTADLLGAIFYILGSLGLLTVDVMEFLSANSPDESSLRTNIAVSVLGSFCYLAGSIGYLPSVEAHTYMLEIWGYILGSALIVISETAKVVKLTKAPVPT
jgi:hypothetical protein